MEDHPHAPRIAPLVTNVASAAALFADLADSAVEIATVAFLDPEWRLLGQHRIRGSDTVVTPSIRLIIADALRLDAASLILAHNHPSGSAEPSAADLAFTRALARAAEPLGIALVDHLIVVAGGAVTSLRSRGLL